MTIRDKRQFELGEKWVQSGKFGIILAAPRFGKIRTTIGVLNRHFTENIKILIAYPDKEIEKSWKNDFEELEYNNPNITYTTHLSINKYVEEIYDIVIIDEIHLLSESQINLTKLLLNNNKYVLGLTGTLSDFSRYTLLKELKLKVIAQYSIEQGISEGIISDYEITIISVPLDNKKTGMFKKTSRTEKEQFKALSWIITSKQMEGDSAMFLRLNRLRLIQNSEAKRLKTIQIINEHINDRILVFCGTINIADNLGIPSYHNKSKDKTVLKDFSEGIGKHLAVVKIGNAGITYKPLNKVILNYFDSNVENFTQKINRCMGMEYNNPDKKAHIFVICSTETVEKQWLTKALSLFDKNKIKYI